MIYKVIRARPRPGCREAFLDQQRVWNDAMARQPGFLSVRVAEDPADPGWLTIVVAMRSRADLERFMAGDHDRVAEATGMPDLYDALEVRILDVVEPGPPAIRLDAAPPRSGPGQQIALLSELYRVSASLRAGVLCGLFDAVGEDGADLSDVCARVGRSRSSVERLVTALAAVGLLDRHGPRVVASRLARQHLVRGAPAYMGDLVLHNTRPALWARWGELSAALSLGSVDPSPDDHRLFLSAMSAIAAGGQAAALLPHVDLSNAGLLLDIGGGHGDYSMALCRRFPALRAVVLEQPASVAFARAAIGAAGLVDRIQVMSGDYRASLPPGPFQAALLSNVLRGETVEAAADVVRRVAASLEPGGLLLVQDLHPDDRPGSGPLAAALFGLHMPEAMNGAPGELKLLLSGAGFTHIEGTPLDGYVVANHLTRARRGEGLLPAPA